MATEMHRRRWAVYDDELEDSDQTISISRRAAAALPLAARLSQTMSRKRPPVKSAYFVETTDDDELGAAPHAFPTSSSARSGRLQQASLSSRHAITSTPATASAPELLVPRLHIGAIEFPVTRSVLWCVCCTRVFFFSLACFIHVRMLDTNECAMNNCRDRRVLAESIGVSIEQVLPRFTVAADALKRVFALFRDTRASVRTRSASRSNDVLCYLCGDAATLVSTKQLVLSRVATTQVPPTACINGMSQ